MKLFIIGGTGRTGKQLTKQALNRGHELTLLVRNPHKVKKTHSKLSIIKGDILDPLTFENELKGHDVVLSALGHKKFFIKTSILSRGTQNIISAMKKNEIKRFICITSLGINESRFKLGLYYTLFTIPVILFFYFKDKEKQEKLIKNSGLNWTIIRPGQLTNGKKRTNYKHGPKLGHYLFTKFISRASVAHFMLDQIDSNEYLHQYSGITN